MKKYADMFILIAGILWGMAGFFVRSLLHIGFDSIQISALRWALSMVLILIASLIFGRKLLKIHIKDVWIFICTGIMCILLSSTLYFVTIPLSTAAVANIMMYTSPIWILVFSIFFLKEKLTFKKVISILLAFIGCAFATGIINTGSLRFTPLGIVTGLGSGLFYGLYSIFGKLALKKYDSLTVTLYTIIFAGLGSIFILDIPKTTTLLTGNLSAIIPICGLVLFITIAPYTLYTVGLKLTSATRASVISCIEPMTSAIIGTIILHEPFTLSQLLGMILILTAGTLLQFKKEIL